MAIRFREFMGSYMEHCHNTQHEDHAMLLRWDVQNPGQTVMLPTPSPEWDGVYFDESYALPTYKTGDPSLTSSTSGGTSGSGSTSGGSGKGGKGK